MRGWVPTAGERSSTFAKAACESPLFASLTAPRATRPPASNGSVSGMVSRVVPSTVTFAVSL